MICWVESGAMRTTPPRASADQISAVGLGQDALGALQPFTSEPDRAFVDPEVEDGVRAQRGWSASARLYQAGLRRAIDAGRLRCGLTQAARGPT